MPTGFATGRAGVVAGVRADEAGGACAQRGSARANRRRWRWQAGRDGTVTLRAPRRDAARRRRSKPARPWAAARRLRDREHLAAAGPAIARTDGGSSPAWQCGLPRGGATVTGKILSVGASLDPVTRSTAKASPAGPTGWCPARATAVIGGASGASRRGGASQRSPDRRQDYVFVRKAMPSRRRGAVAIETGGRAVLSGESGREQATTW
jgi:cobalt-zinc-cadmium efflux system membrane fusion protein